MDYQLIKIEEKYEGQVTEIKLGPPPANILSARMMKEIEAQLDVEEKNPHKKLIVFSGEGKHFGFGASVEEHKPGDVDDMLPSFHNLIGRLINCPVPTLAKVSGLCLGGMFELVLGCDFIFADERAKFGVPEITLGVFPPVAAAVLPLKCGEQFSSQVILSGDSFPADDFFRRGLVNEVVESGKLDETVDLFFEKQLRPKSASSLRIACRASNMTLSENYKKIIGPLEEMYLKELMSTHDAVEGITAFLEKRKPQWEDR